MYEKHLYEPVKTLSSGDRQLSVNSSSQDGSVPDGDQLQEMEWFGEQEGIRVLGVSLKED